MGKAKIISGGEKGLYNIELVEHTARITSDIAKIDARLSLLATAISDAMAAKAIAEADYNAKRSALDTVIGQYTVGAAKKADVDAAQNAYLAAMKTLQAKTSSHSLLLQEQESKTKQKALLEAIPLAHTVDGVWCADLTEDLAAGVEVGTIEPNGEPDGDIVIYPGGSADPFHQQLQPVMASTPAGYFLNMARFPGWQRWKPTFRIGTITALYSAEDYCDVTLDSALSSVQNLNITPSPALTRVPVEYLTCNCGAFTVGDRVVVQFTGQNWSTPKVIGFESNPKGCGEFIIYYCYTETYIEATSTYQAKTAAFVWDVEAGAMLNIPTGDEENPYLENPFDVTDPAFISWYNAKEITGESVIKNIMNTGYRGNDPYGYMGTMNREIDYVSPDRAYYDYRYALWTQFMYLESQIPGRYIAANWPYDGATDYGRNYQTDASYIDIGERHESDVTTKFECDIYAHMQPLINWSTMSIEAGPFGPNSVYGTNTINGQVAYVRAAIQVDSDNHYTKASDPAVYTQDFTETITRTWTSPWGEMGTVVTTLQRTCTTPAESVNCPATLTGIPYYCLTSRTGVAASKINFYRAYWDRAMQYAVASDNSISYAAIAVHCKVSHVYYTDLTKAFFTLISEEMNYPYEREVTVHANAIWRKNGGAKSYDPTTDARDSALESAIIDVVNKSCELNGLPSSRMPLGITVTMEVVK